MAFAPDPKQISPGSTPGKRAYHSSGYWNDLTGLILDIALSSLFVENLLDTASRCENTTMGLEACVYCNCIKEGKAPPHPFPELLAFDAKGEATLRSQNAISLERWLAHDKWYRKSCPHSGHLIEKRIGNISLVAQVRGFLKQNSPNEFPLLLGRVVYSGTHTGDWIAVRDVPQLIGESRKLQGFANDRVIVEFTSDMLEIAEASLATGNPIVF